MPRKGAPGALRIRLRGALAKEKAVEWQALRHCEPGKKGEKG